MANIRAEVASMPPLPGGGFTFFSSTVNRPDHQQDLDFDFGMAQLQSSANSLVVTPNTSENCFNNAQAVQALNSPPEDASFFLEMDMITSLGNSDITDVEMVEVLDKLIT